MDAAITDKWNSYLDMFEPSQKDVYYCEEYAKLYTGDNAKPLCIVVVDGGKVLLMPFMKGQIQDFFDYETPYGYGGPITNTRDEKWLSSALAEMTELFKVSKYLCGFIRFHPLLGNGVYCRNSIDITHDRRTVSIDMSSSEDDIWNLQLTAKNRNMIRKAEKNGLLYRAEYNFASISEFIELYNATMRRLNAELFYIFGSEYYQGLAKKLKGRAFLGTVRKDKKLICGGIFLYSAHYGHYHLAGGAHEAGANNLLLWESARELKRLGVKEFHLGGGFNPGEDNSLLKFKMSFSKNMRDFYIGKIIYNPEPYMKICDEWEKLHPDKAAIFKNRVLKYRY